MSTILAIDSATGPCSVALWKNGQVATYLENIKPSAQSAVLMPMIEEALRRNGINYRDLSYIAATIGPGSFTGIRVSLAAARGIAFAAGIRSIGFTTLETLAFAARKQKPRILAILNAGKGEYYYQPFATSPTWRALGEAKLGALQDAMNMAEDGAIIGNADAEHVAFPRADTLAELAATYQDTAQSLTPFYIRPPDAKLPTKKS